MTMRAAVLGILLLAPTTALAAEPGPDWISIGSVERLLAAEGYRLIEIEAKDDHWEGEAVRHDRTWDFTASPTTGRVLTIEPDTD